MPSTIKKAIGTMKDQTSIGLAKVSSNISPDLKIAIVKATSHDNTPPNEKHIQEILNLTSSSYYSPTLYVHACITSISKRLFKTRDYVVALKALMLIHRLIKDGDPLFKEQVFHAACSGTRMLNLAGFRDEAHSSSWDMSAFVKSYALYLDQRLEFVMLDKDVHVLAKMGCMQRVLDRFLACRPAGLARSCRLVMVALYYVVKESFRLYVEICEVLSVLLDGFFEMEFSDCVKVSEAYSSVAKQIDELIGFYNWCKDVGVGRSSEYPEVKRVDGKVLENLEEFVRERRGRGKSNPRKEEVVEDCKEEESVPDMNEIKALPPPEETLIEPETEREPEVVETKPEVTGDLVDLRDDVVSADDQGNKLALALFSGPGGNANGTWDAFPSNGEVTSAWQTLAAEPGKADWELALVESASNLSKQKAILGGGFDPLSLNGMYDQAIVRQHTSVAQLSGGSASSVALPCPGKSTTPVLALPAPDGTVQTVNEDPFAASLCIPPPSYVQMADMEKKQHLLIQEQVMWQQYAMDGMRGQASLVKLTGGAGYAMPMMPYGMPPINGIATPAGYQYPQC